MLNDRLAAVNSAFAAITNQRSSLKRGALARSKPGLKNTKGTAAK
jgi:hypothetical protein